MPALALFDLTGTGALITGSSRGIGLALAEGLAGAGAEVVLNGRDEKRLSEAAATLKATGAVFAMSDRPDAASGENPRPMRIAPVTATGVPNPAAPTKNAPKQNATTSNCSRRSLVTVVMLCLRTSKSPRSSVRR